MASRKTKPKIICDTREKIPWDFSEDEDFDGCIVRKLDFGDYSLVGMEKVAVVERKRNGGELLTNFISKTSKDRIYREMEKLSECRWPFLIVEESLKSLSDPNNYYAVRKRRVRNPRSVPAIVIGHLNRIVIEFGIHVIFAEDRGQKIAKDLLLKAYKIHHADRTSP